MYYMGENNDAEASYHFEFDFKSNKYEMLNYKGNRAENMLDLYR
ncbi:tetratricopeptide TPR1 repeat-containing protein [Leptospira ellinghausenii]|uniref:Tetratricopeptide TPR1 repeat-containing protein n=1 Tax=Leptospira ellinghausenii TaxID=1917822 RepID=A0A2P2D8B2_9LEPT|nr:tetratricopeptide TPR1 repeat-containing protein [Leptospira ellinghausenii]